MYIIYRAAKKILFQHAGRTSKSPQSAGTFGTTEIAAGGGFKRNRHRIAPLNRFFEEDADVVGRNHLYAVEQPLKGEFAEKIECVVYIKSRHTAKITVFGYPLQSAGF